MSESGRVDANFHEYVHAAPTSMLSALQKDLGSRIVEALSHFPMVRTGAAAPSLLMTS